MPNFGFAMRGAKDYQVVNFNDRMVSNMIMRLEGAVASLSEQVQVVHTFAEKVLSATRMGFGGHVEPGVRR